MSSPWTDSVVLAVHIKIKWGHAADLQLLNPEMLLAHTEELHKRVCAAFEDDENACFEGGLNNVYRAAWKIGLKDEKTTILQPLNACRRLFQSASGFNRWATHEGLPTISIHCGLDAGGVIWIDKGPLGEIVNSAVQLSDVACESQAAIVATRSAMQMGGYDKKQFYYTQVCLKIGVNNRKDVVHLKIEDLDDGVMRGDV